MNKVQVDMLKGFLEELGLKDLVTSESFKLKEVSKEEVERAIKDAEEPIQKELIEIIKEEIEQK